jgi:hypothetical protein
MRTQDEVLTRFREAEASGDDFFGFAREVLGEAMTLETLRAALPSAKELPEWEPADEAELSAEARSYLHFAIEKMQNHRGISAARSVDKLREYAWLLGRDDVVTAMDKAEYENYGAPKVYAYAVGMGWADDWPVDAELARMAAGLPCSTDCESGCGC